MDHRRRLPLLLQRLEPLLVGVLQLKPGIVGNEPRQDLEVVGRSDSMLRVGAGH